MRIAFIASFALMLIAAPAQAQTHPDLSGAWDADFLTPMERPDEVADLIVPPDKAAAIIAKLSELEPGPYDPDADYFFPNKLLTVHGQLRSSMIIEPRDGHLPFTALGKAINARHEDAWQTDFDNPEDRPGGERCLSSLGHPPIRAISVVIPVSIMIAPGAVIITTEDTDSTRIVDMAGHVPPDAIRTRTGYSAGRWDGDTLIVETTHIAASDPSGVIFRDGVMLSEASRIIERFTLISASELLYQFTVTDPALYERPWLAEFVFRRHDGPVFEYACHEGNYGMENILLAARLGKQKPPKPKPDPKKPDDKKSGDRKLADKKPG